MLFTNRASLRKWDYHFVNHKSQELVDYCENFVIILKNQYKGLTLKIFQANNEIRAYGKVITQLRKYSIWNDLSAPYIPAQNGGAERSGGVILARARAIRGKLPYKLHTECLRAAVFLDTRTPKVGLDWKTPQEEFFRLLKEKGYIGRSNRYLDLSFLRVYGYLAYICRTNIP